MRCASLFLLELACWTAGEYAKFEGRRLAETLRCDVDDAIDKHCALFDLPRVLVYSKNRLNLARELGTATQGVPEAGVDVAEVRIPGTDSDDFQYRYSRLRLLEHVNGRIFLVNDNWKNAGLVLVLSDDDPSLRFEFLNF